MPRRAEEPVPGKAGPEGKPGKDADPREVTRLAEERMVEWFNKTLQVAVKSAIRELGELRGPARKDGKDGKDGTPGPARTCRFRWTNRSA